MPRLLVLLACIASLSAPAGAQERATLLATAAASAPTAFDVFVPPGPNPALDALLAAQVTPGSVQYHKFISPAEYRDRFATSAARMTPVALALRALGFVVTGGHAHTLHVTGSVALVERAFATRLSDGAFPSGRHALVASSRLALPAALSRQGAVVAGFAAVNRMRRHSLALSRINPDNRQGGGGPYWVTDLKQAYDFPDARLLDGRGVTIGILMAGDIRQADMANYFRHEKLTAPAISVEEVMGGSPYSPTDSTETHLDIQQSGGLAPGAAIKLYNLPDLSDASILAGLVTIDEENAADIVSMSFGAPELLYTAADNDGQDFTGLLLAMDALFKQGNAEGITFVASSGDAGALGAPPVACLDVLAQPGCGFYGLSVDHPASSPYVTSVGGSNLITASSTNRSNLNSAYIRENAEYDRLTDDAYYGTPAQGAIWGSGGGISLFEPKPDWQALAPTGSALFRTVPDVAGHMGGCIGAAILPCPRERSGDVVAIAGIYEGVAGTSAAAPDFAAILALKEQKAQSRLGNVNPDIYAQGHAQRARKGPTAFHDAFPGDNGFYPATRGYNLVFGNGTVIVRPFIGAASLPPAGVPQTPSNP